MKVLKNNIYFSVFACLYAFILLAESIHIKLPLIFNNYITDLCCMPVVLTLCLVLLQYLPNLKKIIPLSLIVAMVLYWSWYFEWYLPQTNIKYTGDLIDVWMYSVGALSFYIWQKKVYALQLNKSIS